MSGDRYDAFISYNHAVDGALAEALRRGLHGFARPWNRRRAMRVFLDRSSLELTSDIGDALRARLDDAEHLILLASIESAASRWCDEEVRHWLATKGPATLLIVLTDAEGDIVWDAAAGRFDRSRTTALPPSLLDAFEDEPLWLDMSWAEQNGHVGLALRNPVFADAVATLASAMTGTPKDELEGEDVRQHRTFQRLRAAAIAGLVVLTIGAAVMTVVAILNENAAQANRREAQSRELAVRALSTADTAPEVAVLSAVEAMFPGDVDARDLADGSGETDEAAHALGVALRALVGGGAPFVAEIDSPASALAVTPDGRTVAAGSSEDPVALFDIATGTELVRPGAPEPVAELIRFNGDGTWVVAGAPSGSDDGLVVVTSWDVFGRSETSNAVPDAGIRSVSISLDGWFTFAGVETSLLRVSNDSAELPADLGFDSRAPTELQRDGTSPIVETVPLAAGWILVVSEDGSLELLRPEPLPSGCATSVSEPTIGRGPVVGITSSADGGQVAVETTDGARRFVTVAAFDDGCFTAAVEFEIERFDAPSGLTSATIALDADRALALLGAAPVDDAGVGSDVVVVELAAGRVVDRLAAAGAAVVEWLPGRSVLAIGSRDGVRFEVARGLLGFDPRQPNGTWNPVPPVDGDAGTSDPDLGFGAQPTAEATFVDGTIVGFENGDLRRYDRAGGLDERLSSPHRTPISGLAFDEDASLMVSSAPASTGDGTVIEFAVWETATWSVLDRRTSTGGTAGLGATAGVLVSDDDRRLIVSGLSAPEVWPNVDAELACELVSDEAMTTFEATRLDGGESACRRAGVRG